ncbi:phage GP46 family protein [Bordetella petrii]|uniref:Bacteriophage protein GP46 n=1 Tax=Bordetella petrii (strain ATCC BAA-461 / DSM 12804 / CCUG 43448 / CIP 107267 / Se-1111R) TaxID=340100 RepID=A9ID82_BORPD|nr:phage GP46 family protein [Bordetella petrii]CAP44777.1 putative bacteriophage protein GP46 [Bordetella petrii]
MDLALRYDSGAKVFDLLLDGGDLATDEGLTTAVVLSLFTDRRALPEDRLPDGATDRRGWWADAYNSRPHGSRLWLLCREKELDSVLRRAQQYAEEALAWLVEDQIARAVEVEAVHLRRGVLQLLIGIVRSDGTVLQRQYEYVWQNAA